MSLKICCKNIVKIVCTYHFLKKKKWNVAMALPKQKKKMAIVAMPLPKMGGKKNSGCRNHM